MKEARVEAPLPHEWIFIAFLNAEYKPGFLIYTIIMAYHRLMVGNRK
jgi:hypothetical protein